MGPSVHRACGTALVADDEASVREATARILTHHGWDVETAEDGESAVALAATLAEELRVVLLDLSMPKRSGADAVPLIRGLAPGAAIVLMSGYPEDSATAAAVRDLGCPFVEKPFLVRDLLEAIDEALGRGG